MIITQEEFPSDILNFTIEQNKLPPNHLICLGKGDWAERQLLNLYINKNVEVPQTPYYTGLDEVAQTYNYSNVESDEELLKSGKEKLLKSTSTSLSVGRLASVSTEFGNYALFGGGFSSSGYLKTVEIFNAVADFVVYKGSKYKFQNMIEEETVTADMETISIPTPATGYIKFKNTTI